MPERVIQRRCVGDEGLRVLKPCRAGRTPCKRMTVPLEEAPANPVPAAAVRREGPALPGFTGCKGSVGGQMCLA